MLSVKHRPNSPINKTKEPSMRGSITKECCNINIPKHVKESLYCKTCGAYHEYTPPKCIKFSKSDIQTIPAVHELSGTTYYQSVITKIVFKDTHYLISTTESSFSCKISNNEYISVSDKSKTESKSHRLYIRPSDTKEDIIAQIPEAIKGSRTKLITKQEYDTAYATVIVLLNYASSLK